MAQTKSQFMVSVESDLLTKFRAEKRNLSQFVNEAMKKEIDNKDEQSPEMKEKRLQEQIENEKKQIENSQKTIEFNQKALENIENEKILYAEKMKNEAILRSQAHQTKIKREISYFPTFKKQGVLSTPIKREAYFRKRAKILGMELEDYMVEIVSEGEKLQVM